MSSSEVAVGVAAAVALGTAIYQHQKSKSHRYPPGPKPEPIIGNLRHVPPKNPWLTWADMGKEYGPLVYYNVLGKSMLIVNSYEAAKELLEKRGKIYSDRPEWTMLKNLSGGGHLTPSRAYGPTLRAQRKLLTTALNPRAIQNTYGNFIEVETHKYLNLLLEKPEDFWEGLHISQASTVLNITYGEVKDGEHDFIHMGDKNMAIFDEALSGTFLVDWIPSLQFIPDWMPGAHFKHQAALWKVELKELMEIPFEMVKKRRALGKAVESFTSLQLDDNDAVQGGAEGEKLVKETAISMFAGGSDTTRNLLQVFILAMLLNPHIQQHAQQEIDQVTGGIRLPTSDDKESLPYIGAILTETLRWQTIGPLGVPHQSIEDDMYNDYYIPKGTIIIANAWAMSQDTTQYPNPQVFDPNRWIPTDAKAKLPLDPREYAFGFGRRICPGVHLAHSSAWLMMVSLLATFDIKKKRDAQGVEIEPKVEFSDGVVSAPLQFPCDFIPRSDRASTLIKEAIAAQQ